MSEVTTGLLGSLALVAADRFVCDIENASCFGQILCNVSDMACWDSGVPQYIVGIGSSEQQRMQDIRANRTRTTEQLKEVSALDFSPRMWCRTPELSPSDSVGCLRKGQA